MRETYERAIRQVLKHEGGYGVHPSDPGGPTNFGITIADARTYWKPGASAADVQAMPINVAREIYRKHYADAIRYDELPAGVDYAVLDYGINSGVSRSAKVLQRILNVDPVDGKIGLVTLAAASTTDAASTIRSIYRERLAFLKRLKTWPTFGTGWARRCEEGLALALTLAKQYPVKPPLPIPAPETAPAPIDKKSDTGAKAIPEEPEVKPPVKSKTIWGGILGYFTGVGAAISAVFQHLNNKYALIAFAGIAIIGSIALYLIIKGRIDIGKVAEQLKEAE